MTTDFAAITRDLEVAFAHHLERQRRQRRRLRVAGISAFVATSFSAAAIASGIGGDLQLDPTKWSILGGGSVDDGRGAYVHASNLEDGSGSTFLVEHDAGLPAYRAFLLHEETLAAAQSTSPVLVRREPGELCTPAALTQAETVALATLRSGYPAGATADATRSRRVPARELRERSLQRTRIRGRASEACLRARSARVHADAGRGASRSVH